MVLSPSIHLELIVAVVCCNWSGVKGRSHYRVRSFPLYFSEVVV